MRCSAAQAAADALAGDPRKEESFANKQEWRAYQDEWFKTVTMGGVLPPTGDANRKLRWSKTREQRGVREATRARQQQQQQQQQDEGADAAYYRGYAAACHSATSCSAMVAAGDAARAEYNRGGGMVQQAEAAGAAAGEEERRVAVEAQEAARFSTVDAMLTSPVAAVGEAETAAHELDRRLPSGPRGRDAEAEMGRQLAESGRQDAAQAKRDGAGAEKAAAKKRAEDVYDAVCTESVPALHQLLSKEEEGSAAASQLAGELATALMRHIEVYPQPAEQVAFLDELSETTFENSVEWRAARVRDRELVVPPAWLTDKCGRQYTHLLRGALRDEVLKFLKERARRAAVAAQRKVLASALAAKAAQCCVKMQADDYAQNSYELRPPAECCPLNFNGTEEHSPSERAAVNRHLMLGLMLELVAMSPGVRKLHDALSREEQALWADFREHPREQRLSAVRIHGEGEQVEQLDRATRLEMAILVNERLTYYGVPLFHCYTRVEIYLARLLGEDVVDADNFQFCCAW